MAGKVIAGNPAVKTAGAAIVQEVLNKIRAEQGKLDRSEGAIVPIMVAIGVHLCELKKCSGRQWGNSVRELDYHPRAASRLQKLAGTWWREIGTIGSDLLAKLPADPQKAERLCRLSREQLETFLAKEDCKKLNRKQIKDAVKAILGEYDEPKTQTCGDVAKSIERSFVRMKDKIEVWSQQQQPGDDERSQIQDLLASGITELTAILDSPVTTSEDQR